MEWLPNKSKNLYFVSPHLDDAVFSSGGLLSELSKKGYNITLINVFTKPSTGPYTLSIKKFLKSCGYTDAFKLYKDRISEDHDVAKKLGIKVINLNFIDALWRKKNLKFPFNMFAKIIPEMGYIYPIFRFAIAKGKIDKRDKKLITNVELKIKKVIKKQSVVFAPMAIGNHPDHQIVRNVSQKLFKQIIYWADYPYIKNSDADKNFIKNNHLAIHNLKINTSKKNELVNMYKTQIKAMFKKKIATVDTKERYYL